MDINLNKISQLISQKLKKDVELVAIEKIGSGYHSDGFKLTGKDGHSYFLKKVKSSDLGFEIPERKVSSLLVSDGMGKRTGFSPRPIGVVIDSGDEIAIMPDINTETEIFHIQEFESEGTSYWSLLQEKKAKTKVDEQDIKELEAVADLIVKIHSIKYPDNDLERQKTVYRDGIRATLTNSELTMMFLHEYEEENPFIPPSKQEEYVGLIINQLHKWKNRSDRLCALHGDFWGANLFFRPDKSTWIIDYSRIPWGDPGIDVGWWLSQYLWFYHETGNEYFKELGEAWLNIYEQKTGDKEIREAVAIVFGLMGVIFTTPKFYPDRDVVIGKKWMANILQILREGKFLWTE